MKLIYQLLKLRFLTPYSLLLLYRAKRTHGNNSCFLLKFAADHYGNKIAITDGISPLNFKELYEAVLSLSFTINNKVRPGKDAVAILVCNNSIGHILTLFAIQNLGIKLILVNHKLHINEINKIRNKQEGRSLLFASPLTSSTIEDAINIEELIAGSGTGKKEKLSSKDHARLIFPTSGTTGDPKLIEKKTGEFYWIHSFADLIERTSIDKRNAVHISIPISHGFGYTALLFTLILGKKALIADIKYQDKIADLLLKEKADLLVGVPATLYQLAETLEGTDHHIHSMISGGAALNETIFNKLSQTLNKNIFSMYGSTEGSTSFIANYAQLSQNICALGTPLKGVQYRLDHLATGGNELLIRSGLSNTSTNSGWLRTGDLVKEDANGYLTWCSRKDNMIIKGGVNIYPVEIETALLRNPAIEDVYVIGEKDLLKGEIIAAFVKMKPAFVFNEKTINNSLRQTLSGIKIPDIIQEVSNFEYTNTGKKIRPTLVFNKELY